MQNGPDMLSTGLLVRIGVSLKDKENSENLMSGLVRMESPFMRVAILLLIRLIINHWHKYVSTSGTLQLNYRKLLPKHMQGLLLVGLSSTLKVPITVLTLEKKHLWLC